MAAHAWASPPRASSAAALGGRAAAAPAAALRRRAAPRTAASRRPAAARAEAPPAAAPLAPPPPVRPEAEVAGLTALLDSLKWDASGLVAAIAQDADTGEVLMQAFADRAALAETLQTGLATFYSRSRGERWCKGETSGHFIRVHSVHLDCDRDSLIYLSSPIGPACHTNAPTCYFTELAVTGGAAGGGALALRETGAHASRAGSPLPTLRALERTIAARRAEAAAGAATAAKPSWTARLLADEALLCSKVREEAGELCETLEKAEGAARAASEAADLFYHAMVLLNAQGVSLAEVSAVLRRRFGTSGVEEKAAR